MVKARLLAKSTALLGFWITGLLLLQALYLPTLSEPKILLLFTISSLRAYGSYQEMISKELALPVGQRIDFVSIATPNHTHFEIAKSFAEAGINVICDKPMTFDLAQAEELVKVVEKSNVVFALTHNYTGYPLVRQAREMILSGELGEINAIRAFISKAGFVLG